MTVAGAAKLVPYIAAGATTGAGVSMVQKKDPLKGAAYGAGTGGIGAGLIGSTSPQAKALATQTKTFTTQVEALKKAMPIISPSSTLTPSIISVEARRAGEAERRRLQRRRGRLSTIFAGKKRGVLQPITTARAGLKTTFG